MEIMYIMHHFILNPLNLDGFRPSLQNLKLQQIKNETFQVRAVKITVHLEI